MTTPGWKAPSGRSKTKCWGKPCPPITRRPNDNSLSASKAGITSAAATVPWAINRQLLLKRSSWKINHNKITSAPVHLLGGTSQCYRPTSSHSGWRQLEFSSDDFWFGGG